ncbi:hypothetical protein PS2_003793 [Malus domestica]
MLPRCHAASWSPARVRVPILWLCFSGRNLGKLDSTAKKKDADQEEGLTSPLLFTSYAPVAGDLHPHNRRAWWKTKQLELDYDLLKSFSSSWNSSSVHHSSTTYPKQSLMEKSQDRKQKAKARNKWKSQDVKLVFDDEQHMGDTAKARNKWKSQDVKLVFDDEQHMGDTAKARNKWKSQDVKLVFDDE